MPGPQYQQFQGYPNAVGNFFAGRDAGYGRAKEGFNDQQTLETQNALVQQAGAQSYPALQAQQMQAKQMLDMYMPTLKLAVENRNTELVKKISETYQQSNNPILQKLSGMLGSVKFLDKDKYKIRYKADTPEEMAALKKAMPSLGNHPQLQPGVEYEFELEGGWGDPNTRVHSALPVETKGGGSKTSITGKEDVERWVKAIPDSNPKKETIRQYLLDLVERNKGAEIRADLKDGVLTGTADVTGLSAANSAPATRNRDVGDKQITEEWRDGAWVKVGEAPRWNTRGNAREDRLAANQQFKNEREMRQDFEKLPEVKNYNEMNIKAGQMTQAIEESRKTKNFTAVDQALITMFNKMTDPQSVVRESEYARTSNDMSLVNAVKGKAQKILDGGAGLTTMERSALKVMSDRFLSASKNRYDSVAGEYRNLAKTYGYEPNNVVFRGTAKNSPKSAEDVLAAFQKANPTMKRADIEVDPVYLQQLQKLGLGGK